MTRSIAARIHTAALRAEDGQGTVEYVGLAMHSYYSSTDR